jgi:hypothetical protein
MRKLKNKYLAWGLLGALVGFLFALVNDVTFRDAEERRGKRGERLYKPDPNIWFVWAVLGGVAGGVLSLVPLVVRSLRHHPVRTLVGLCLASYRPFRDIWSGIFQEERRYSTTSLGESPSLQPVARTAYPLPAAADDTMGIGVSK